MSTEPVLAAALSLAEEYGLPVFPCRRHAEVVAGREYNPKSPIPIHGFKDATGNIEQIAEWWTSRPDSLVGVPTGRTTKLLVIDVDPDGKEWYRENATRLNCGRVHKTPRGFHLLYRMPEADISISAGKVAPGVDVRGTGGYVIWWPAHGHEATGDQADLTAAPQWLIDAILSAAPPRDNTEAKTNGGGTGIQQGSRNASLTSLAGKMRHAGATQGEIADALAVMNGRCEPPLSAGEVHGIAASVARYEAGNGAAEEAPSIVLRHVADIVDERRETQWLNGLHKILERRVIAILAGCRDTLKSFIATHWAMTAAMAGESVVILSGEGGGLGRRIEAWMKELAPARELRDLKVVALERVVRLNAAEVMLALIDAIDAAGIIPALIVIDTLSKFTPGMKENTSEEVAAFLHLLSTALRDRYSCTVLLVAHAGHGDAKRPRGSSVLMANPDAEYIANRPDPAALNVLVSRDRFKDSPTLPPLAYAAQVCDLGRIDSYGEPVSSLVLWTAAAGAVIASKPALTGKARLKVLTALQERSPDCTAVWSVEELRAIGREVELHKNSARTAVDYLLTYGYLIPAEGGRWKLRPS